MSDAGKDQNAEKLSAVELKQHLYHKFRERGILDEMRAQLRNRLVTELHQGAVIPHKKKEKAITKSDSQPLLLQITNWLIADHLRKYGYDYTLSIFVTDCPTVNSAEELFSLSDILSLLRIDPKSETYKMLTGSSRGNQSILLLLLQLLGLGMTDGNKWQEDQGIQTELMQMSVTYNFKEKLQQVDDLYLLKKGALKIELEGNVETYLLKYQRNLEEQLRKQSKAELESYKERELQQVKLAEKEHYRTQLDEIRKDLEQEYRQKFESLISRERKAMEEYEKLKDDLEKETFLQRQEVLSQLDSTRAQELNYKRQAEMFQRECELEKERFKNLSEKIKIREDALTQKEISLDSQVKQLTSQQRFQEQREHLEKMAELQKKELQMDDLTKHLEEQKKKCEEKEREATNVITKLQEQEIELNGLKLTNSSLSQQIALLNENLRDFEEYKKSKSEAEFLRREIKAIQEKLIVTEQDLMKSHNQLWELKENANKPNPQVVTLQQAIENQKAARDLDKAVWQEQRNRMEIQLNSALDRNKALNMKIEQQTSLMDHMQHIIQDLRDQLHQAYSTLNIAVVKSNQKTEGYLSEKNSSLTERNHHLGYDTYFDTSLNMSCLPPELELHNLKLSPVSDKLLDDSIVYKNKEFLEESRRRMKALEEEAKKLERRYLGFQQQMKRPSTIPLHSENDFDKQTGLFSDRLMLKEPGSYLQRQLYTEDLAINHFSSRNKTPYYDKKQYEKLTNPNFLSSQKKNYCIVPTGDTFDWSFSQKHLTPQSHKHLHDLDIGRDLVLGKPDPLNSTLQEETLEKTAKPVTEAEFKDQGKITDERTFELVINPRSGYNRITATSDNCEITEADEKEKQNGNRGQESLHLTSQTLGSTELISSARNDHTNVKQDLKMVSLISTGIDDNKPIPTNKNGAFYNIESHVSSPPESLADTRPVDLDSFWKISKLETIDYSQAGSSDVAESSSRTTKTAINVDVPHVTSSHLSKVNLDSGSESDDELHLRSSKDDNKNNAVIIHQKPVVNLDLAWKTKTQDSFETQELSSNSINRQTSSKQQSNLQEQQFPIRSVSGQLEIVDRDPASEETDKDKDLSLSDKRKLNVHFNDNVLLIAEDDKTQAVAGDEKQISEDSELNISAASVEEQLDFDDW